MKKTLKTKISVITAFILSIIIFTAYVANAAGAQCITLTGENVVDLGQDCYYVKVPVGTSGQLQYTLNEVDGIQPEGKAVFHNRRQNQNILTLSKDGKYTAKEYGKQRIEHYHINYSRKIIKKRPDLKYNGFPEIYPSRIIDIEVVDKNGNSVEEIPFYRLYNPKSGRYVFTRFMTERDRLIKKGYKDEGTGWQLSTNTGYITLKEMFDRSKEAEKEIQNTNETEEKFGIGREAYVYQFENTLTKDRIYTNVEEEYVFLNKHKFWERIEYNSYSKAEYDVPVYRLYCKKGLKGVHHYTKDENEKNQLVAAGWRDEGIAFYAK